MLTAGVVGVGKSPDPKGRGRNFIDMAKGLSDGGVGWKYEILSHLAREVGVILSGNGTLGLVQ